MRRILALDEPGDYVIASGRAACVREFVAAAFARMGLDWRDHVKIDPSLVQKVKRGPLVGNPEKLARTTGWTARTTFGAVGGDHGGCGTGRGRRMMSKQRTLVMIPTYNESENVEVIASGILSTGVRRRPAFRRRRFARRDGRHPGSHGGRVPASPGSASPGKIGHRLRSQGRHPMGIPARLYPAADNGFLISVTRLPTFHGYWPRATTATWWWGRDSWRQTASKAGLGLRS